MKKTYSRRQFAGRLSWAAAALALPGFSAKGPWELGCFTRPWAKWSLDEGLRAIGSAGFKTVGLLSPVAGDPFLDPNGEAVARLKDKIAGHGLRPNMIALRLRGNLLERRPDELKGEVERQVDRAAELGVKTVLTFGVDNPRAEDKFFECIRQATQRAQRRGLEVAIKPHGGVSADSNRLLRCLEQVNQPNFKIWYDAGNIIYYTGKDPIKELEPVVGHVTGLCAKDCAKLHGGVMIQFGTGKVDFKALLAKLKAGAFHGPVMIECCAPADTPDGVAAHARQNRQFLGKILEALE